MGNDKAEKKRLKARIKFAKAQAKLAEGEQSQSVVSSENQASPALKFAEAVRGLLYLLGSASLVLAVVLQERGVWITLDEIVENLLVIRAGQVVLIVIALALFIYGLKHIRLVR
ncbi:hypothetical protein KAI54_01965 [Candidatus Gracilibacteria bacterium]|nr:hypothetical protein [Candidatus Gracilibacteria bacterium]